MARYRPSRIISYFGTEEPVSKQQEFTAGDLSMLLDSGGVRYIRYRGVEVLRGISFLVRDKNWGTYNATISSLKIKTRKDGFNISYLATCEDADQEIHYSAEIEGDSAGTIRFSANATPRTDFLTNRTGFVVLHPLEGVVGEPVEIVHTDGKSETQEFPKVISPCQPVFEIRSLKHTVVPGVTATVLMEGNKFEMEDHRNWMDASYKTYVCSLLDPWPYTLPAGKTFTQSVTVTVDGNPKQSSRTIQSDAINIEIGKVHGTFPRVGSAIPMDEAKYVNSYWDLIDSMRLSNLVCQIDGRREDQLEAAAAFAYLAREISVPVKLEIVLPAKKSAAEEMAEIAAIVEKGKLQPESIVVTQIHDLKSFQPNTARPWGPTYAEMAKAARSCFPGLPVGGGMMSYFTELNRKPTPKDLFDFVTHSVCPIVHAADDVSVMETLESLPWIFASARAIMGDAPYHIGPSGIPCRDNPYGAAVAHNPDGNRMCLADNDPRQRSLFAAAWNIGLMTQVARGGIDEIALGAVTGPQGAIYRKMLMAQPWYEHVDAKVYPVYHVLAGMAKLSGQSSRTVLSSAPANVAALCAGSGDTMTLWLANLTADSQQVNVSGFDRAAQISRINFESFEDVAKEADYLSTGAQRVKAIKALELLPYETVRIVST